MFHPYANEYTFYSIVHGHFSKMDHMLKHKAKLNRYIKTEIIQSILSNHYVIKEKEQQI